jgi:hypothetical protein
MESGGKIMNQYAIRLITPLSPERVIVSDFIQGQYVKHMQVRPSLPEIIFAAFRNRAVIATIGLEFSDATTPMHCEKTFSFDWKTLPLPTERSLTALYTRWIVTEREASGKILHAATLFAIEQGKTHGWCELKPAVARRLTHLGVRLHEVCDATLCQDGIDESVRSYYETIPHPKLYQMSLAQMNHALA